MGNVFLGWTYPTLPLPHADMTNKTAIITGANSGIGFVIARELANQGAHVYVACRSQVKGRSAIDRIKDHVGPQAKVTLLPLDTSSLKSCRDFASNWIALGFPQIDLLIHNAGVAGAPKGQEFTEDGLEYMYQTNFLSNFVLTRLLEEKLSASARIIFNSSAAAYGGALAPEFKTTAVKNEVEAGFHAVGDYQYGQSKFMQIAFAKALRLRWAESQNIGDRIAVAFAPGYTTSAIMDTRSSESLSADPIGRLLVRFKGTLATPTEQGAATGIWLAVEERKAFGDGLFFERMTHLTSAADLLKRDVLDKLWVRWCADAELET